MDDDVLGRIAARAEVWRDLSAVRCAHCGSETRVVTHEQPMGRTGRSMIVVATHCPTGCGR